jgi:hypothetical protein
MGASFGESGCHLAWVQSERSQTASSETQRLDVMSNLRAQLCTFRPTALLPRETDGLTQAHGTGRAPPVVVALTEHTPMLPAVFNRRPFAADTSVVSWLQERPHTQTYHDGTIRDSSPDLRHRCRPAALLSLSRPADGASETIFRPITVCTYIHREVTPGSKVGARRSERPAAGRVRMTAESQPLCDVSGEKGCLAR